MSEQTPPGKPLRILWHWFAMGPYHFARMRAVAAQPGVDLTVVETTAQDDHGWVRDAEKLGFRTITLSHIDLASGAYRATRKALEESLERVSPDVIVASGYSEPNSRAAIWSFREKHPEVPVVFWTETAAFDHRRTPWNEAAKRWIISGFDGALAAGSPHSAYMRDLGMPASRIREIGGCVDNRYFAGMSDSLRGDPAAPRPVREPYFVYVGRFVPQKNLAFLIRAYHLYRVLEPVDPCGLVLVGSGPLEKELRELVANLRLDGVHFAGNRQIEELPSYYAHAKAFVLPSTVEPWGLVVNEAMASGLPILASTQCGCAADLIEEGRNGFLFDPKDTSALAAALRRVAAATHETWSAWAEDSRRRIERFSPERYAQEAVAHLREIRLNHRKTPPARLLRYAAQVETMLR